MSQPRTIKDYFKRPAHTLPPPTVNLPALSQPSSPLSEPPSDLPSHFPSSQQLPEPAERQTNSSAHGLGSPNRTVPSYTGDFTSFRPSSSLNASFNSSQRIVKNGKEVVIDTDAESASSEELEDVDELLNKFLGRAPSSPAPRKIPESRDLKTRTASTKPPNRKQHEFRNFRAKVGLDEKKYKFSLESLVQRSVDDDEIETNVAKAKAILEAQNHTIPTTNGLKDKSGRSNLREDILASGLSSDNTGSDFKRLLDAVKRTEALEQEKSWLFFGDSSKKQDVPEFPRDSILASSREAFLREPFTRERAFLSGIVDFALSRDVLPDEVFMWIFRSVSLEPRDELRYAYCRAIKSAKRERIESLIGQTDIDQLFFSLGGHLTAVDRNESILADMSYHQAETSHNWSFLLSVLQMLGDIADCLHADTREHTLHILFRLTLDTAVSHNDTVIASLENTLNYLLRSIPREEFEKVVQPIGKTLLKTIKDTQFQSKLLNHILSSSREIAIFKCRLAMAFLTKDESPLHNFKEIIPFRKILNYLRTARLDSQLHKARLDSDYDYMEVKAVTSLLNIVIDTGRTTLVFPNKEAERKFNEDVDSLAEQVKRIFSAMEDSGASHLKRTEAKQGLEALQYRILYSIRTKRRVKSMFGHSSPIKKIGDYAGFKKTVEQS